MCQLPGPLDRVISGEGADGGLCFFFVPGVCFRPLTPAPPWHSSAYHYCCCGDTVSRSATLTVYPSLPLKLGGKNLRKQTKVYLVRYQYLSTPSTTCVTLPVLPPLSESICAVAARALCALRHTHTHTPAGQNVYFRRSTFAMQT